MKDNKNLPSLPDKDVDRPFKGYTMEELKYQRAMMALKVEFSKEQLMASLRSFHPSNAKTAKGSGLVSKLGLAGRLTSKFFSGLNTLDYVMMGMSLFGTAKKAYGLFIKKK